MTRVPLLVLLLAATGQAIVRDLLYPFGPDYDDKALAVSDDNSTSEIHLETRITFYDHHYSGIYVNLNGMLTFETELPVFKSDLILPFGKLKMIAPFYADVDTRLSGNVYYRETEDPSMLSTAAAAVQKQFPSHHHFMPTSLFIVTWDDVGYFERQWDKTNTFQVVIASNGHNSFVTFYYPEDGIKWLTGQGKHSHRAPDVPAQAGFDAGDNRRSYTLPDSGNREVAELARWSNIGEEGVWMFHVGNTRGGDVGLPEGNELVNDPGVEAASCAEGGQDTCNENARCEDHSSGFCCHCLDGYFGNGVNCLRPGDSQRVNGKVNGVINGVPIEGEDLHTYIVTQDGRVFTAISKVGPNIGRAMQSLWPIGGVLSWLFAKQTSPKTPNGYALTGGDLKRQATIRFGTGESVEVSQEIVSSDAQGYMRMTTNVNGEIPQIAQGAQVAVQDTKEDFRRAGPGVMKSYSTHTYSVDDRPLRVTVDQTITYNECPHAAPKNAEAQKVVISRMFLIYNDGEQTVRYASNNKMVAASGGGGGGSGDPCADLGQECDTDAECRAVAGGHRCVCNAGYRGDGLRGRCQDLDECATNRDECDVNAQCINTVGSHECRCLNGYTGDGRTCTRDRRCADMICDINANCVYDSERGEPKCECKAGFMGDGELCQAVVFSCNEVDSCDENAECLLQPETGLYACECNDGFSGDGYTCSDTGEPELSCKQCDVNAQCTYDVDKLMFRCQCAAGFTGDGYSCSPIEEQSCNVLDNCGNNAECVYDRSQGYQCRCSVGFQGDGYICEPESCNRADNCDRNARCQYDTNMRDYVCVCNTGYTGDGYFCEQAGCDVVDNCDRNAECDYDFGEGMYVCKCNEGYEGDGTYCREQIRTCNELNNCHAHAQCLYDDDLDTFRCQCDAGYDGNGFFCQRSALPSGESSYLLFAQGMSVMDLPFSATPAHPGKPAIYVPGQTAIGIDVDCQEDYFYWTDVSGKAISKARLDGSDSEVVVSGLGSPEGVAIDWIGRNMYWTDSTLDRIEVSKLDGSNRKTLFDSALINPRAIEVDPGRGFIFWTDWNRDAPKIERANMDGSERKVLVETGLRLPNGLTLDYSQQRVCWVDAETKKIECVDYNGRGRREVYDRAGYAFDLVFANNNFYWTDWDRNVVPSISNHGLSANTPLTMPPGGNGRPYGITAVRDQCPAGNNACSLNNGGCTFLCLPTPNGGRSCACPDDIDEDECNRIGLLLKK